MNSYQLQELIKNIQTMMRCPSCGATYGSDRIHFLGQLDMAALIQLDCQSCELPVMATIIVSDKHDGAPKIASDITEGELDLTSGDPVATDHVVDMHQFLQEFDGDFQSTFDQV